MIKDKSGFTLTTLEGWLLGIYSQMLLLIVALPAFPQGTPAQQFPPRRSQQNQDSYINRPATRRAPNSAATGLAGVGLSLIPLTTPDGSSSFKIPGLCPVQRYGYFCGFPGKPPVKAELLSLKNGSTERRYTWTAGADEIGMNVIYSVFPFVIAQATDATIRELDMRQAVEINVRRGGRVTAIRQVNVQGYPGWELSTCCEGTPSFSGFHRTVYVGNRKFGFTISVHDHDVDRFRDDINEFLNSLVIRK
jgi:hypothetical protein